MYVNGQSCLCTLAHTHTHTHTHSLVGATRGNVKNSLGKQLSLNTVERLACPVAAREGGDIVPLVWRVHRVIAQKWPMISHPWEWWQCTRRAQIINMVLLLVSHTTMSWYFDHDNDHIYWLCITSATTKSNNPLVAKKCTLSPKNQQPYPTALRRVLWTAAMNQCVPNTQ